MSSDKLSSTDTAGQSTAGAAVMASSLPAQETMTYQERRMSGQVAFGYETGRRRTSSFGSYTRVVVVAVDPSDNAKQAFDWYLANVWKLDDLIVLVHCPESPKLPTLLPFKSGLQPPLDDWKRILDDMNTKARKLEEEYEITCTMRKLKHKVRCEAMKNVGEGICRIADEEGADLIVCGTRGMSGLRFSTKGSVCEYIMRNSPIPTVVIPSQKSHF